MKTVMVDVTQADIDRGEPGDSTCCPLALAISRAVGKPVGVGTTDWWARANEHEYGWTKLFPLPYSAKKFRLEFDTIDRSRCRPISFDIEISEASEISKIPERAL